jgi:hypothetical protein
MMTYKVKLVSQTNAILLLFALMIAFFIEAAIFFPHGLHNETLSIVLTIFEFSLAIFLWQKFVTGRTEWTVDENRITVSWTKKFAFADTGDYVFEWKEIERIWQGLDPNYYNLKFKLTSGRTFTFYHATFGTDDFRDLIKVLYQTFNEKKKLQST